jgi:hypothetical protein
VSGWSCFSGRRGGWTFRGGGGSWRRGKLPATCGGWGEVIVYSENRYLWIPNVGG